ncbi:MAG: 1-phosphofructokinase family hexose kinase [Candidatus Rifleibacteriota bacterium]
MIVTVTPNPLLDYVLHSKNIPDPGGRRTEQIPFTVGGKGINVARMLKTLGRPALALSFAGGENGRKIRQGLIQQGISADLIETAAETRMGINLVVEQPSYHTWWIENGLELSKSEVYNFLDSLEKRMPEVRFVAMSGTIPGRLNDDFYLKVLSVCLKFRSEVYLDARGTPLKKACEIGRFFLKHNREEAIETFKIDPMSEPKKFFSCLAAKKIWGAMITDGKNPVLLWDGENIFELHPAEARQISAVGCGDATLAGLLYGRSEGLDLIESAIWGLAAGAADAEMPGPCEADYPRVCEKKSQIKFKKII